MKGSHGSVTIIDDTTVCKKFKTSRDFNHIYIYIRELASIKKIHPHPNIIKIKSFNTIEHKIYLDRYAYDLSHVINKIPRDKIPEITYQILIAVKHAETYGILHRDLKPYNILIDINTHTVVLCDWSLARSLIHGSNDLFTNEVQSEMYRAPELYDNRANTDKFVSPYGSEIEVWSIGIIILNMLRSSISRHTLNDILSSDNPDLADLLRHMLVENKEMRYSLDDCINHRIFNPFRSSGQSTPIPKSTPALPEIDQTIYSLPNKLNIDMRSSLIDWLFELQMDIECADITLSTTVYYIDLFLSKTQYTIDIDTFQLIGISSFIIANNLYDKTLCDIKYAYEACHKVFTEKQIKQTVSLIIKTFDGHLYVDTEYHHLQMLYKKYFFNSLTIENINICDTIAIYSLTDFRLRQYAPQDVALAILLYHIMYKSYNLTIEDILSEYKSIESDGINPIMEILSQVLDAYDVDDGIPDDYS